MKQPDPLRLVNPYRRYVRNFLVLAAIFLGLSAVAVLIPALPVARYLGPGSGGATAIILTLALCLPLTMSMVVSALFTQKNVNRAERSFVEFREGHYLAHWTYSPEEWRAYVDEVARGLNKINWPLIVLTLGLTGLTGILGGWSVGKTLLEKIGWSLILPGGTFIVGGVVFALVRLIGRRRCRRLLAAVPQAYLGKNAVYCGGEFNFWDAGLQALQSVKVLEGPPRTLEFLIGLSPSGQSAFSMLGMASMAVRRPMAVSSFRIRQIIPVPSGAEAVAEQLARTYADQTGGAAKIA